MNSLIDLLIVLVILGVLAWAIGQIPMPPLFKTVVNVVFALILVVYLIGLLTGHGIYLPRIR